MSTVAAAHRAVVTEAPDESSALAAARASGQRVEVLAKRTERAQVFANPSGTLTMEQYNLPVRVRQGDGWSPVDATLRVQDGWLVPAAAVVDFRFSTGGDGPVMVLSKGDKRLTLGWPGRLPAPVLKGDRATYPDVLPGVDLQAVAQPTAARLLIVVKTREAAANPALRRIGYRLTSEGLTVRSDPKSGAASVVDPSGETVFFVGSPVMWDSADTAPTVTQQQGDRSRRQSAVRMDLGPAELALVPDDKLFTDPAAVYPVVVDPFFPAPWVGWTHIDSGFPRQNYLNDPNRPDIPVGAYVHTNGNTHLSISYFGFGTIPLQGKQIIHATFKAFQIHNAPFACVQTPVQLVMTGWFDQSTTWEKPPAFRRFITETTSAFKADNGNCPANYVEFNATSAVADAAAGNWEGLALAMQAPNWETFNRKRFNKDAALVVEYNTPPSVSGLTADINLPCSTGASLPATNTSPTLWATGSDADGDNVEVLFEWGVADSGQISGSYRHPFRPSGSRFSAVIPTIGLQNGKTYSWHATPGDGGVWGGGSAWCSFTYDTTKPTAMPLVSSTSWPDPNDIGAPVGVRGEFTFRSSDPDVYGYRYGLTESTTYFVVAGSDPQRSAMVPVTAWTDNPQFLYVYSVDQAGNRSATPASYRFTARPNTAARPHVRNDVNGDGLADVSVVQQRDDDESGFLNFTSKGGGEWYPPIRTWDSGPNTKFLLNGMQPATGDFNGDGRTDLAVLRDEGNNGITVWVFRGNGTGYDVPAGPSWTSGAGYWWFSSSRTIAGDVNGDGKTDLISFYQYANFEMAIWVFYGSANGLAVPVIVYDSGVGQWDLGRSREVAGDANGDGKADISVFYKVDNGVTKMLILRGTANGVTAPTQVWESTGWWLESIKAVAGDFNGDAKSDVGAFYGYGGGQTKLWTFYGTATGVGGGAPWDSGPNSWWWENIKAATGDYNGDGKADIAAFYDYGNGNTKLWVFDGGNASTGVNPPVLRWDGGDWGLDWTRTNFY